MKYRLFIAEEVLRRIKFFYDPIIKYHDSGKKSEIKLEKSEKTENIFIKKTEQYIYKNIINKLMNTLQRQLMTV